MADVRVAEWQDVEPIMSRFYVWTGSPERAWFQKAWESLAKAGLTSYSSEIERHWVLARAVALGFMYGDYCQLEWNVYFDSSSLVGELFWDDEFSHLRLGSMAAEWLSLDVTDPHELFEEALDGLVSEVRLNVYDALVTGFGHPCLLHAGLFISREPGNDQESLDSVSDDLLGASENPGKGRDEAFTYVVCASMLGLDA